MEAARRAATVTIAATRGNDAPSATPVDPPRPCAKASQANAALLRSTEMPSAAQLAHRSPNAGSATARRAAVKSCPTVSRLAATPNSARSRSENATTERGNLVPVQAQTGLSSLRAARSEEHTSELQSRSDLVCRLLLEKKKLSASSGL